MSKAATPPGTLRASAKPPVSIAVQHLKPSLLLMSHDSCHLCAFRRSFTQDLPEEEVVKLETSEVLTGSLLVWI